MRNFLFFLFKEETKSYLTELWNVAKDNIYKWGFFNLIFPLALFLAPLLAIKFFEMRQPYEILQVLHNGSIPLISIMLIVSITNLNLTNSEIYNRKIIRNNFKYSAIIIVLFAIIFYLAETTSDRSKSDSNYWLLGLSIMTLILSSYVTMIFMMFQKENINNLIKSKKQNVRQIRNENQIANDE